MKSNYRLLAGAGLLGVIIILGLVSLPDEKVVFLNVGQGDATLLQSGTVQVLVDGGPGRSVLRELARELPWFDRRIEVVVLTHPQQDHMEGLLHVLERYEVGMVLLPAVAHTSQLQEAWLAAIEERGIPYRFAWAGQSVTAGEMKIVVLGPFDSPEAQATTRADLNNASVVTRIDFDFADKPAGNLSLLLTGDAEKRAEKMLVEAYGGGSTPQSPAKGGTAGLHVDVIKAGHHGSNSSTHDLLLGAATPRAAVISVGAGNRFGHPHPVVLERLSGIPTWRTDEVGPVRLVLVDDRWLLSCGAGRRLQNENGSCMNTP